VRSDLSDADRHFIDTCRHYLDAEYLPRIRRCVERLDEADLWWRANDASNSIGNLVLHLAGNVRQWIATGVGGRTDIRERAAEFAADGADASGAWDGPRLLEHLEKALAEVDEVLAELSPADLMERTTVQGKDVTYLEAVFHAVEHFSMHTGQIIYITKTRTGADLGFYEIDAGTARRTW